MYHRMPELYLNVLQL